MDTRLDNIPVPENPTVIREIDLSFPRVNRLLEESDYKTVFSAGIRVKLTRFIGQVTTNSLGCARLGLAVSKKSCRDASDRNRLKRIVREYFRHNKHHFGGRDFIVLVTPAARTSTPKVLRLELEKLFSKLCQRAPLTSNYVEPQLTQSKPIRR